MASTENIRMWIEQSDIDYIGHFIKAWIPFNAWYNDTFSSLTSDRQKISAIKSQNNTVRRGINSLMESDSQLGQEFRSNLSALYYQLQQNQIDGRDGRIWFEDALKEKNNIDLIDNREFGRDKYYLKRTDGQYLGQVSEMKIILKKKSDNSTTFVYTHTEYDITHLQSFPAYQSLSHTKKEQVRIMFQELKPIRIETLLETNKNESPINYYQCDSYVLRREPTNSCYSIYVVKALLEILYQLRNVLFHGELVPNKGAQNVYKEAYLVLKMILAKIR
ncbi:hypothetical protein [Polaribacter ponticola]|uniref:Apea-like HEPN domain-containing protein n=1 Tax=Polaribacter ponticola TaxID=2978475 RepID=A0ABT5S6Q6_9FLAO|nr:hypothetical protein [Polaribacter sp. MSW5]MDD7913778.1 hypothetical protein [Polaribacter sp. MSW5]